MAPTISVILPVYNRFDLTKRAVESVLGQTLPATEILLIDDGSFDGTSDLLPREVAENLSWRGRVRYVRQENEGPGAARNNGLAQAKGEWVSFLDNDDLWLPWKLESQIRALEHFKDQCSACITDAWFMNNSAMKMTLFELAGKRHTEPLGIIQEPLMYMLARGPGSVHPVWLQNLLVRTDLARSAGGFDPDLRFGDDDDFAFRLGCATKFCFVNTPMVLIDRTPPAVRHLGASKEWDDQRFRLRMAERRFEKRLGIGGGLPGKVHTRIRADLAAVHSEWANLFLQQGERTEAKRASSRAIRLHPAPGIAAKWALIRCAPGLAAKIVSARDEYQRRKLSGIG